MYKTQSTAITVNKQPEGQKEPPSPAQTLLERLAPAAAAAAWPGLAAAGRLASPAEPLSNNEGYKQGECRFLFPSPSFSNLYVRLLQKMFTLLFPFFIYKYVVYYSTLLYGYGSSVLILCSDAIDNVETVYTRGHINYRPTIKLLQ